MTQPPTPPESAEQWVTRTVHGLPLRSAPQSLQHRVQAELARRAALPWWRQNFAQWPMAARAGFVLLCIALMALMAYFGKAHDFSAAPMAWAQQANATVTSASGFIALLLRNIPSSWLLIAAGIALLYTVLFGLGAIAYRALYLQPSTAGDRS